MIVAPTKIRRRLRGGLSIEQAHNRAAIAAMFDLAGAAPPDDLSDRAKCFLMAYWSDDPIGVAGLETQVDAALMRPLFVLQSMRRRGVGSALVRAVRVAAHTRGARSLYAIVPFARAGYLARFGFAETGGAELVEAFSEILQQPLGSHPHGPCRVVCMDISRDGLIER